MNKFIMLVGLPMTGKTYSENAVKRDFYEGGNIFRISSDDFIEEIAYVLYMTYDEVWNDVKNLAQKALDKRVKGYFETVKLDNRKQFVIWDQTNLTTKSRAQKLANVPKEGWEKIAIIYPRPGMIDYTFRQKKRKEEGKFIPQEVLDKMEENYKDPTFSEGFDKIYVYKKDTNSFSKITRDIENNVV